MDTPRPIGQRADGTWDRSGPPTIVKPFRITQDHAAKLKEEPYLGNASVLVRMLLQMYFEGKIPIARFQFLKRLNECKSGE